jgi:hypothetical protein
VSRLACAIQNTYVEMGRPAIFWLGQAGFVYKTPGGQVIYIDPYLTDCVERHVGYKRIMATPIQPEEVEADLLVSTHAHADRLDMDAMPILANNQRNWSLRRPRRTGPTCARCDSECGQHQSMARRRLCLSP